MEDWRLEDWKTWKSGSTLNRQPRIRGAGQINPAFAGQAINQSEPEMQSQLHGQCV